MLRIFIIAKPVKIDPKLPCFVIEPPVAISAGAPSVPGLAVMPHVTGLIRAPPVVHRESTEIKRRVRYVEGCRVVQALVKAVRAIPSGIPLRLSPEVGQRQCCHVERSDSARWAVGVRVWEVVGDRLQGTVDGGVGVARQDLRVVGCAVVRHRAVDIEEFPAGGGVVCSIAAPS